MTTLTETAGLERQLATFTDNSRALVDQNARLDQEIHDAEAGIRERRLAQHENLVTMAANDRKAIAVTALIREFTDADETRKRALADYRP